MRDRDGIHGEAFTKRVQGMADGPHAAAERSPEEHSQRLLAAGTKPNLAKLTVARRCAGIVLRLWKDEKEYEADKLRTKRKNVVSPAHRSLASTARTRRTGTEGEKS